MKFFARIQRVLATAFCWHVVMNMAFSSFVFGMPTILFVPRRFDPDRRLPHRIGTFFWGWLVWRLVPFWRLEVRGLEHLSGGPKVLCTNHQSLLDVLATMALGRDFKWVSGVRFFKIPLLAMYMRATGYIAADLKNPFAAAGILDECGRWLDSGVSVGLFPEGTRSRDGRMASFKAGAFQVAVDRHVPVVPIVIEGTRDILPKGSWTFLGASPFKTVQVEVLKPIEIDDLPEPSAEALSRAARGAIARRLAAIRSTSLSSVLLGGDKDPLLAAVPDPQCPDAAPPPALAPASCEEPGPASLAAAPQG